MTYNHYTREETHYARQNRSGYFAAVCKHTLFAYAIEDKEEGSFIL